MKQNEPPVSRLQTAIHMALGGAVLSFAGMIVGAAYLQLMDPPPSLTLEMLKRMPTAGLFLSTFAGMFCQSVKEADGNIRPALLPGALLLTGFILAGLGSSFSAASLWLCVPLLALAGVSFRLAPKARRLNRHHTGTAYGLAAMLLFIAAIDIPRRILDGAAESSSGSELLSKLLMGTMVSAGIVFFFWLNRPRKETEETTLDVQIRIR